MLAESTAASGDSMTIRTANLEGVATIEIARPEKKNALTQSMYLAMASAITAAVEDRTVRALLITGQPGIFTAGNDLEDFLSAPPLAAGSPTTAFMQALLSCDKPVVAAVTGAAIGIGATMLLHCDLVYLSDQARLVFPFVTLGVVPEFGSSLLLPRLMGHARAAEKLLLAEPISAEAAVSLGIATAVLPSSEVLAHARRVATRFNDLPPGAVRDTKRLMRAGAAAGISGAMEAESSLFIERLRSPEAREALQAFFEKRKPDFASR
jgi:enoyl-CoA hydratase/carnithine racemase